MRRLLLIAVASVASLAVLVPSPASAAVRCRGMTDEGLEITRLRAMGLGCADARRVARAWVRSEECGDIGNPEECTVRRYLCTRSSGPGFGETVVCRRSSRRVSFRADPA